MDVKTMTVVDKKLVGVRQGRGRDAWLVAVLAAGAAAMSWYVIAAEDRAPCT
jgi:hypothetical protein